MTKIALLGAGSWGSALALILSKKGYQIKIWTANKKHLAEMREKGENTKYLPGIKFNEHISFAEEIADAIEGSDMVLFAVPAQAFRGVLKQADPYLKQNMILVNVAKGIEMGSLKLLSEIAEEELTDKSLVKRYVVLSGPSHAEEVSLGNIPTTVSIACEDEEVAKRAQEIFATDSFRTYTNSDIIGLQLGGAIKNIIALGAGISDGLGFGDNTKAALMTRGLTEMERLGVAYGAKPETFFGLSGVGDLIVTCTSMHSRNRRCGILIGQGMEPETAVEQIGMVVEGMYTCEAAYQLAKKVGVEMPITEAIYNIINGKIDAKQAVLQLMARGLKSER